MLQLYHSDFVWVKFYQSLFEKFVNTDQTHFLLRWKQWMEDWEICIDQENRVVCIAHEVLLAEFNYLQQFSFWDN